MLSIRTQDRMTLVPYNNVIKINENTFTMVDDEFNVKVINNGTYNIILNDTTLGTYATKGRALGVLDEIENAVRDNQNMFDEYVSSDYGGYNKRSVVKTIYQMPKE